MLVNCMEVLHHLIWGKPSLQRTRQRPENVYNLLKILVRPEYGILQGVPFCKLGMYSIFSSWAETAPFPCFGERLGISQPVTCGG